MKINSFGKTEKGEDHLENEDSILVDDKLKLYAVADGVTLPYGGKEAAERAIAYLKSYFKGDLKKTIETVNKKICDDKLKNSNIGSTTLTAGYIRNNIINIGHVGDSYAFIVRKDKIKEITSPDGVRGTGILFQAIGQLDIDVHFYEETLQKRDYIIFSSDGVTDILNNKEILTIVKKYEKPKDIVEALIKETKNKPRSYRDDLSVIVLFVK